MPYPTTLTATDTKGCNGYQIIGKIETETDLDFDGHYKFGPSKSILEAWNAGTYHVGPTWVETVEIPADDADGIDSANPLTDGVDYFLRASGTADAGDSIEFDVQYSFRTGSSIEENPWTDDVSTYEGYGTGLLDLFVDGSDIDWGLYNAAHEYEYLITGTGAVVNLGVYDVYYPNNVRSLFVDIYENLWVDLW